MNKKGRYWVFAFDDCYPLGGMNDFKFSFNNLEEFEERILEKTDYMYFQVLDTNSNFMFDGDIGTITKWVCRNIGDEIYEDDII